MKSIFITLIALSAITTVNSCKKCVDCTLTITTTVNVPSTVYPQTSTANFELCGTNKDIEAAEKMGTVTAQSTSGVITATVKEVTTCN